VQYEAMETIFKSADIISLHCPLNDNTKHMINKSSLLQMKDNIMLINTSRGALINTTDIIESLKNGKVGYLGIDVYEQEEKLFFKDLSEDIIQDDDIQRLTSFPNMLLTAHQAFFTNEALTQIALTTFRNVSDLIAKKDFDNKAALLN
jgi:D-lactate dehydrogenase